MSINPVNVSESRIAGGRQGLRRFLWVFRQYIPFMKPHWHKLVLILLLLPFAATILTGVVPIFSALILDDAFPRKDFAAVAWLTALIFGMGILREINYLAMAYVRFNVKLNILRTLGTKFYDHLLHLPLSWHRKHTAGERIFRSSVDVHDAAAMIAVSVPTAVSMIIQGAVTAVLTVLVDWRALVVVLIFMPPYFYFSQRITSVWRSTDRSMRKARSEVTAQLQQTYSAPHVVQAYTREKTETRYYMHALSGFLRRFLQWQILGGITEGFVHPAGLAVAFAFFTNALWGYFHINGSLSLGQWVALNTLLSNVLVPSGSVVLYFQAVRRDMVAAERVLEVLETHSDLPQPKTPVSLRDIEGRIEFRNVNFGYTPAVSVLNNVSFTIEPGSTVAFVGRSGTGKSTILHLIMRLSDPQSGAVLIDGHDIRTLELTPVRRRMGMVLQRPHLFAGTVRDNIVYGCDRGLCSGDSDSDEEVRRAIAIAECTEFIAQLPGGIDTCLSESGDLSGGQKQRLTIARALARRPRILLLDEPLASLDPETQKRISENLAKSTGQRTTIFATYHLPLVTGADNIYVLEEGHIIESGTYNDLLSKNGAFTRLVHEYATGHGAAASEPSFEGSTS